MKGLVHIPTSENFQYAYGKLQTLRTAATPDQLAQWSQWSRFDARLAEQLIEHLGLHWKEVSPLALHEVLLREPWPAVFGVLLEHIDFFSQPEDLFHAWANLVMTGIQPASGEQFFIGTRAFAGKSMFEDALLAIHPYRKWGYLAQDILINKSAAKNSSKPSGRHQAKTLIPVKARRAVLDELLRHRSRITVRDYRMALNDKISQRQAELDLRAHPRLNPRGQTRARFYVRK